MSSVRGTQRQGAEATRWGLTPRRGGDSAVRHPADDASETAAEAGERKRRESRQWAVEAASKVTHSERRAQGDALKVTHKRKRGGKESVLARAKEEARKMPGFPDWIPDLRCCFVLLSCTFYVNKKEVLGKL